jgi:hypothetical protein
MWVENRKSKENLFSRCIVFLYTSRTWQRPPYSRWNTFPMGKGRMSDIPEKSPEYARGSFPSILTSESCKPKPTRSLAFSPRHRQRKSSVANVTEAFSSDNSLSSLARLVSILRAIAAAHKRASPVDNWRL